MKWLRWALRIVGALVISLIIAFAALAYLSSRDEYNDMNTTIIIQRPQAAVWKWLYEPDKVKSWVSWLVEVRRDGNEPPIPGKPFVWVMEDGNNGGAKMEINSMVEQAETARRLAVRISSGDLFKGRTAYTLIDRGNGSTQLNVESHYEVAGSLHKILMPIIHWQAEKKMNTDLDHLRQLVEAAAQ